LIPFVVGLLGIVRNLHFVAIQISERISRKNEKGIAIDWDDGRFLYSLKGGTKLQLKASRPERRRSFDCLSLMSLETGSSFMEDARGPESFTSKLGL